MSGKKRTSAGKQLKLFLILVGVSVVLAICALVCAFMFRELTRKTVLEPQVVLPLPGELSAEPLFNSNNPEEVRTEGILLSTMGTGGKATPDAHLDFAFSGKFGIFSHHVAKPPSGNDRRTLYEGLLLHNPGNGVAHVIVTGGASSLMEPGAPYNDANAMVASPNGQVYSGAGSRASDEVVRGLSPEDTLIKKEVSIASGETVVLAKLPISVRNLPDPCNKRSTLLYLDADKGSVQVADVAVFADFDNQSATDVVPADEKFISMLNEGRRAGPPEPPATEPGQKGGPFRYGRVAGVSQGTHWRSAAGNTKAVDIAKPGEQFSYVVSSLKFGTLGTVQDQSAPMLVRYPGSACRAQGNYGLYYDVNFNLKNSTEQAHGVDVLFQTPLKSDKKSDCLTFADPPHVLVFYRGTVCITYTDDRGAEHTDYFHIIQRRGERGIKMATLQIAPGATRQVRIQLVYAADATPPQVITFKTRP
ncbi:MAG: DUF3370 domain-containing protein [Candidatus Obscuribacterales bacterium]